MKKLFKSGVIFMTMDFFIIFISSTYPSIVISYICHI